MRYANTVEVEAPRSGVHDGILIGTVGYALLLGIGMVMVGRRAQQRWLAFWGVTLVAASAVFLTVTALG